MGRNYIGHLSQDRSTIEKIIAGSGLYSLTATATSLSAYYSEQDPTNDNEYNEWLTNVEKVQELLGERGNGSVGRKTERLWVYGHGNRAIPYESVTGQFRPSEKIEALSTAQGKERFKDLGFDIIDKLGLVLVEGEFPRSRGIGTAI